ncbi:potassium-transporting ATPase subunit KdpA [Deinococcus maricopensis]|uniref:Potassium-transporting ATPase potassium-binding subunit n=1 Tax=Deinococcus maricopensis (strain DSM 21211 / LMG 22137 / NRRL B-23946 / LB-34) TaxID=709986 RepID=E8U851_DEIML|nr:potassium-transporting ATPase subunit KdpA [Deinococcus maricopensis]ADV67240.1 potassium-transporting ATPase, A subunit [Deinococcus maricopensis DSM 21211]
MTILFTYLLVFALAWPLGGYIARVFRGERTLTDALAPLERALVRLIGANPDRGMTWQAYGRALLLSNIPLALLAFLVYAFQAPLPLNPDRIGNMPWFVALNTAASFITNTNWQNYSGQAQLGYLAQMLGVTALQFITPAAGIAVLFAILRGLNGGVNADAPAGAPRDFGNYYVDVVRALTRVLLPASVVLALLLTWQGVPSTFSGAKTAALLEPQTVTVNGAAQPVTTQTIPVGPVAAMVAIKQLGTNGGGWYGPNSAVPLENPTALSNVLEGAAILVLPVALVFATGAFLRRPKFGVMILGVMTLLSAALVALSVVAERAPNPAFAGLASGANLEGKELRLGVDASAFWAAITTQTSNGSVNAMHDSLNPLTGAVPLAGLFLNDVYGGLGVGVINFLLFVLLTVFIAGLMVGRTPELFGRKIEAREIKLVSLALLLQPLLILGFTAVTLAMPAVTANSNPGFHGLSQVLYAYTSQFANNGSAFAGLGTANSVWHNVTGAAVLILARYIPMLAPLAIAGSLARKRVAPHTLGTLRVDTPVFAGTLLSVMLILTLLNFLPALMLGPVGEHVTARAGTFQGAPR